MTDSCSHPTDKVFYERNIFLDEDGCEEEEENYWCKDCNRYLTMSTVLEIQSREDWITWQTEY